jgi:hypothetical protein
MSKELIDNTMYDYGLGFPGRGTCFCTSRDVFSARLDAFIRETDRYLEGAIIGEIGNNTFDHNFNYSADFPRGIYFNRDRSDMIVLADYGCGIRKTLSRVVPTLSSDLEALETAFTKVISGRAPEQRGNGLKFVLSNMLDNQWSMYFQSGDGCCRLVHGMVAYETVTSSVPGCLAILNFGNSHVEQVL